MSYLLNVSFVFDEKIEPQFSIWSKNTETLSNHSLYRVIGSNEGSITYCAQIKLENIVLVQQKTAELHMLLHSALKKDFNEEIVFFMSALESI